MIKKIISDGQPGSARAALEVALKLDITPGGTITKERRLKWGIFPGVDNLMEIAGSDPSECLKANIIESDGTLSIFRGTILGDLEQAKKLAQKNDRPLLAVDLDQSAAFEAAQDISSWIDSFSIETLNIIGPREKEDPLIHQATCNILETALYMGYIETNLQHPTPAPPGERLVPTNVDQATARLISDLPLKDRTLIANMGAGELSSLRATLGRYMVNKYGLLMGNPELLASCEEVCGKENLDAADAADVIIRNLWQELRKTHKLRIVK